MESHVYFIVDFVINWRYVICYLLIVTVLMVIVFSD